MAQSVRPADVGVSVGQILHNKYRVDSILGHGGMGVVAECTHLQLNERVAIKMLRRDVLLDQDAVERFQREARAAAKLKSEYVAKVSDVGTFENGVPYMVMEFLEGLDLGQLIKERGVLPMPWAVEIALQTCEALAEAHSLGIVHRDVKPTNLFVTWRPDGSALVKVLDFGISKSPTGTDMHLTQTQSLLGTPAYMSPEQMRSARLVDSRTDIWSLGTVLYEILEGRKPFEAESFSEMCVKVAVDAPAPMMNTPPPLQQVILRCLAKSPEQRFASMAELGAELVMFAQDPHQAQVLVDRMTRMLRRGAVDFSGDTGAGVPRLVGDVASSPVRVSTPGPWQRGGEPKSDPSGRAWRGGSDPSGKPWHGGSEPMMAPYLQPTPSPYRTDSTPQHFDRMTEVTHGGPIAVGGATVHPTKRRMWPFVVVAFCVAAGVGGAIAFTRGGDDSEHVNAPTPTEPTQVLPSTAPAEPAPTQPAVPAVQPDPKPAAIEAAPAVKDAPKDVAKDAPKDVAKDVAKDKPRAGTPPKTAKTGKTATNGKPSTLPTTLAKPEETKTPPAVKDTSPPTTEVKDCDVFRYPHGCPVH